MNTADSSRSQLGTISLSLCLGGVLAAMALIPAARWFEYDSHSVSYFTFLGFEIAALVLGLKSWSSPLGRVGAVAAGVLSVGSLLFVS